MSHKKGWKRAAACLLAAGSLLACSADMLTVYAAQEPQIETSGDTPSVQAETPETAETATEGAADQAAELGGAPELDEIRRMMYADLPGAPTGSYIGSYGLPIATGDTRISISEWVTDLYNGVDAHIDAEALHADGEVITVERMAGEDYAIVPIMIQVEYPANGSTTEIILPDSVTLLNYEGDAADEEEAENILRASYTETSAAAQGIYVQAAQDFTAEFVYTAPDGTELCKSLQVKVSEGGSANPIAAANGGISTYAAGPTPPFMTGKISKIDYQGGTWLIWFNGREPVLLKDTAFQIYWMDDQGNHIYDADGNAKLVTMTDTTDPLLPKDVDTFYTDDTGMLVLPEKLPLGHYRLVEVNGPNGFYNEWMAGAAYDDDGHLQIDDTGNFADGSFYVDFSVTTDRVYKATGDDSEDGQDILVIDEEYRNHETLGVLKIRKTGEVVTGWQEDEGGTFDPEFSGEARPGHFVYAERPIPYAEYTITANEDIYTQDRQTDANGNRTLWYAKGDVVAVVQTGDGAASIARFAPGRTNATYDFLSVVHEAGAVGEVSVTLPLGSYHVEESGVPYGFVGTRQSYDVTFAWDNQLNDVVMATTITSNPGDGSASQTSTYPIINATDADAAEIEAQVLKFHNERVKPKLDIYKTDSKTGQPLAGAVYNLYTVDDIFSATGTLLFRAGDLIATSAPTDANGHTTFTCDFPMRGQFYGTSGVQIPENTTANSGHYIIRELRPPEGYYLDAPEQEFEFVYQGGDTPVIKLEQTFQNDGTCHNWMPVGKHRSRL